MKKKLPLIKIVQNQGHTPEKARALIMSGKVIVDGAKETRTGISIAENADIVILQKRKYVSRAAYKLLGAIQKFKPQIKDRICIDLGAAHGGFTQVLLEFEAGRVYSIDVAYGLLDFSIRRNERVVVLEKSNVRNLNTDWFAQDDIVHQDGFFLSCDLSFISLRSILPILSSFGESITGPLECILLIKPQFEASKMTDGGILKDEKIRTRIIGEICFFSEELGFSLSGESPACISGADGNQEHVIFIRYDHR